MTRSVLALGSALAIASAPMWAQAPKSIGDVSTLGCIRLWQPAQSDPTKMPPDRQPGLAGVYLLTPISSNPASGGDLPTYVLTPSGTLNYAQHVGHKVEVTGTSQAAPPLAAAGKDIAAIPMRPENRATTNSMPRLTLTTMKMVTENCP